MLQALQDTVRRVKPRVEIDVLGENDYVYNSEINTIATGHLPGDDTVVVRRYGWLMCSVETYLEFDADSNTVYIPTGMGDHPSIIAASEKLREIGFNVDSKPIEQ